MTALAPPVCTDTTLPGVTRREWRAPAVRSHSAVAVTPAGFRLTGAAETVIELATVRRVTLDLVANTLTLDAADEITIAFADAETADAVYTAVWRRLGQRFVLTPPRRSSWELARTPVAFMAGVLTATIALSLTANALADVGGGSGPLAAFAPADWRVVGGLGGAALAGLQVWLYRRLTRPPHRLELTPQG